MASRPVSRSQAQEPLSPRMLMTKTSLIRTEYLSSNWDSYKRVRSVCGSPKWEIPSFVVSVTRMILELGVTRLVCLDLLGRGPFRPCYWGTDPHSGISYHSWALNSYWDPCC